MTDVIQTLRGVSAGTDINAMYNPQDTVENNFIKGTGPFVPDNMEEVQTMRHQVMSVLNACPHHVSADFRNISAGVKRWVRRLKGKGNDKDHSDFSVSKFQCHMEEGLFHVPVTDVLDIADRIFQWGSLLDRKRNEEKIPQNRESKVIPKQSHHTALSRESQPIRRTLHADIVERYIQ